MKPTSSLLKGKVAFTGRLASMKRAEAFALVKAEGGAPRQGVTKQTSVLVVGALGWPLLADGRPASSLARAKEYKIPTVGERSFLEWVGRLAPDDQAKTYSLDQLANLSKLPAGVVERLSLFGLIGHGDTFGFCDLTAARQIRDLFDAGVGLSTITKSLMEIRKWLPGADLAKLRLFAEADDKILVAQLGGRTNRSGQFELPVGRAQESPDELFEQAQAAEAANANADAERLYRRAMKLDPSDPAAPFNLGNLFRSIGRKADAEAAYRAATRADPAYAEAWYNLADLLEDQGRTDKAVASLRRALDADPDYTDAIFNMALLLQRAEHYVAAADFWRRYLALDATSAWATKARRGLKFCEMQARAAPRKSR